MCFDGHEIVVVESLARRSPLNCQRDLCLSPLNSIRFEWTPLECNKGLKVESSTFFLRDRLDSTRLSTQLDLFLTLTLTLNRMKSFSPQTKSADIE